MFVAAGAVMILALLLVSAIKVAQASTGSAVMLSRFQWLTALQTLTLDYLGDDPADPRASVSSSTSFRTRRRGFATCGSAPF